MALTADSKELDMGVQPMVEVVEASTEVSKKGASLALRLRDEVSRVLEGLDLQSTTLGQVRTALEANLGLQAGELDEHKSAIRSLLEEKIQQMQSEQIAEDEADAVDAEGAQTPEPKSKDKQKKRKRRLMQAAVHLMKKCRHAAEPSKAIEAEAMPKPELNLEGVEGPLRVTIGGVEVAVPLKTLYSGRQGFHTYQPLSIEMGGRRLEMTCMISCAIAESKDVASQEAVAPQPEEGEVEAVPDVEEQIQEGQAEKEAEAEDEAAADKPEDETLATLFGEESADEAEE